jgi:Cas7 group CRISPR-associated protein Csh2
MNHEIQLHHKLITLPTGKRASDFVAERHDIVLLFDCAKSNPNGDPDTGNMPRVQPDSLKGLVTDVCQKRKVRNFLSLYNPDGTPRADSAVLPGYQIFIRENAVLKDDLDRTHQARSKFIFGKLTQGLVERGFLDTAAATEITRESEFDEFPAKPKDCAGFVLKACQNSLNFAPLVAVAADALAARAEFGNQIADQLRSFELNTGSTGTQATADVTDEQQQSPENSETETEEEPAESESEATSPKPKKPNKLTPEVVAINAVIERTKALAKPLKGKGLVKLSSGVVKNAMDQCRPSVLLQDLFGQLPLEGAVRAAVCECYFDVRAFGAVVSTKGPLEGSFYGQIRGPIQFTFAESLDKVLQIDATITRCAKASKDEQSSDDAANRTMGRKHGIDYGLYRSHIHFSPAFAAKTGFTYYDLDNFLFALANMFRDDPASGRFLRVVGLVDFQHQSALGNAPAHKLFELVEVKGNKKTQDGKEVFESSGSEFPRTGEAGKVIDYHGSAPGNLDKHIPVPGFESKGITARQVVWEIPEVKESK